MARLICLNFVLFALACPSSMAAETKDTPAAAHTRNKKLKAKVTVDWKGITLKEAFKDISSQLEDTKLGPMSVTTVVGVSLDTKVTYEAKAKPLDEVLDGMLSTLELGYVVVAKEKDRYDGWLKVTKGKERGYEVGHEPAKEATTPGAVAGTMPAKPADPVVKPAENEEDEKQAKMKIDQAKKFADEGKKDQALVLITYVLKKFPNTKAAIDAKELKGKLNP